MIAAVWVGAVAVGSGRRRRGRDPAAPGRRARLGLVLPTGDELEARFGEPALVPVRSDDERMIG